MKPRYKIVWCPYRKYCEGNLKSLVKEFLSVQTCVQVGISQ